jgi:hypothetical protein
MREPEWLDEEAGPVVRPYALIRGRARSSGDHFDLIATVTSTMTSTGTSKGISKGTATGASAFEPGAVGPEQQRILEFAARPVSVADVAAEIDLPLGVVRVLLGDLQDLGLISVRSPAQVAPLPSERILKEVINGLRAL